MALPFPTLWSYHNLSNPSLLLDFSVVFSCFWIKNIGWETSSSLILELRLERELSLFRRSPCWDFGHQRTGRTWKSNPNWSCLYCCDLKQCPSPQPHRIDCTPLLHVKRFGRIKERPWDRSREAWRVANRHSESWMRSRA